MTRFALLCAPLLLAGSAAYGQVGSLQGKVMDGEKPIRGALIKIERTDIKGDYQVKTKKKGQWFHAGLPLGQYNVSVEIDGQVADRVMGVRVGLGEPQEINFDLAEVRARQEAASAAATAGQAPPQEVMNQMSPEERKRYEEELKKRQEQLSKNKELNDLFNAGMMAKKTQDFAGAVENLSKAVEIDPEQHVIWANLADAQVNLADKKAGPERAEQLNDAIASYGKAIEANPEGAADYHNNMGLAYVKLGELDKGAEELSKAATLNPANAGQYYYNLGAVMVNTGNSQAAIDAFKKATEVDPNYANAYYQLGTALVGSAQIKEDGTVEPVPGTVEAFQKYLELEPNGPYAPSAQSMIASLSGAVETKFESKN